MAKSDDILKKYGITQVRGSEGKTGASTQTTSSPKVTSGNSSKADTILAKYGITQVRGSEGNSNAQANRQTGSAQNWVNSSAAHLKNAEDYFKTWRGKNDTGYAALRRENSSLLAEAYNLRNQYSDDKEATEYIEEVITALQNAGSSFKKYSDYYGQWETEDAYKSYWDQQKVYEQYAAYDLAAGEKEIAELEAQLADMEQAKQSGPATMWQQREQHVTAAPNRQDISYNPHAMWQQGVVETPEMTEEEKLRRLISQKKQEYILSKRYQESAEFDAAAQNADFGEYSAALENEDDLYNWINNEQFRAEYEAPFRRNGVQSKYSYNGYDYMNEDEVKLFNYYYATEGKKKALEYLDNIQERLNIRAGTEIAQDLQGKTGAEIAYGGAVGLDQFVGGMRGAWDLTFGNDKYIPISRQQAAGQAIREDLADDGLQLPKWLGGGSIAQAGYDLVSTTANMAPSILASVIAPPVGSTLMGVSAAGNAYQQAINEGYDVDAARAYGTAIGVAETAMQSILGGISAFGGISPAVEKAVAGIDNGILRFMAQYGASIASEGLEEGLQEILDPILKNAFFYEDEKVDWAQVVYAALLGGLSAGVIEGVGGVAANAITNAETKQSYGIAQQELVKEALEIDPDNSFAQRMQNRLDKGKDLSGKQLNKLVQQNEKAIAQMPETEVAEEPAAEETAEVAAKPERLRPEQYRELLKAAQLPQTGTETVAGEVASVQENAAAMAQTEPVAATVRENRTVSEVENVPANDRQMTGKLTAEESTEVPEKEMTLEEASQKYGAQAGAMMRTYNEGQDVEKFDNAYRTAYDMGRIGIDRAYLAKNETASYLTEDQRQLAYEAGVKAAGAKAAAKDAENRAAANGKTGWKKGGVVRGEGVKIADLKKAFNDSRGKAYRSLSTIAKATGINIVLYKSQTDADGNFIEAQGKFDPSNPNELWIDINAGLSNVSEVEDLERYVLLRTFTHEFSHFIEKWNPIRYNEFRKAAFDTMTARGEDVNRLIELRMEKDGLDYEAASREVLADALVDILPDSSFVQQLAEKHQTIFQKLIEKLKEFAQNLRDYFDNLGVEENRGVEALREQVGNSVKYIDSIVKMWDEIAVQAVETYQMTVATEEVDISEVESAGSDNATEAPDNATEPDDNATGAPAEMDEAAPVAEEATEPPAEETVIPPKEETEEAKQELRKAVRMPIQGTNMEALLEGIKNRELSLASVTFNGTVEGFNTEQRSHLVEKLLEGVYTDSDVIKIEVPYDGKFEIVNTPGNVAKVLENLKVKARQEILFDKKTISLLTSNGDVRIVDLDGKKYLSNSYVMLPATEAAVEYAKTELKGRENPLHPEVAKAFENADNPLQDAPTEAKLGKTPVLIFNVDGKKLFFDKRLFSPLDGGKLYYADIRGTGILKSVDVSGNVMGYLMGIRPSGKTEVTGEKPSNLKSYARKKAQETLQKEKPASKPKSEPKPKAAPKTTKPATVETSVKLEDFGEKIGGARKDQWSKRGLLAEDLDAMNDREREKNVKKDNVWKRPDYRKLIEGGADRNILFVRNEIRKALNQNIAYPYRVSEARKQQMQEEFVATVRAIQEMAEKVTTKAELAAMGRPWLIENGYRTENSFTEKWRRNAALQGTNYVQTIEHLVRNWDQLSKLADKANFAVDAEKKIPSGVSIHEDDSNHTWFIARGNWVVRHSIPSYEEALSYLQNAASNTKKKTRFVPEQLLEVHRKGPNYRGSKDVKGQDYLDTFGFKGGEFGNWMTEKDRRVSMNYGFDALKDLADALAIVDKDISLSGNLSIAFGARGQGLSGAAAHYEQERHVINLTKMNGAGSLAHEWFHALDDFLGGYGSKFATEYGSQLPETTKTAIRHLLTTMQYRDATQEETDMAATKAYEQARRIVTYQVANQFGWVRRIEEGKFNESDARYYSRKPTEADVKKYHELLDKLLETGDMAVLEELSALRKEVAGHVIPKEDRESIGFRLLSLRPDATKNVQKMRLRSDFYNNSRRFGELHHKDGDYWDSTIEMAARAFACYVADKTSKNNDYLSAHSDTAVTLDVDKNGNVNVIRAFPVGEERVQINAAFDQLIAALKEDGFLHEQAETVKPETIQYQRRYRNNKSQNHDTDGGDVVQYQTRESLSDHTPIQAGMTDSQRYEALKGRSITITAKVNTGKLNSIEEMLGQRAEDANLLTETNRKKLFVKIGSEFSVFKSYENIDVNLTFAFSRNNLRESVNKQKKNYSDFAKMLSCFDDIIDAAVGIEVHNRNDDGYKIDPTLKNVYVLVSAFEDGDQIIPVKLEIKEFSDKDNALYVAIALESIKKDEVVKQGNTTIGVTQSSRSSTVSLTDLFSKINPRDESFLKYVPAQFLQKTDNEQHQQRRQVLTNREVLEMAVDELEVSDLTPGERSALDIFKGRLDKLKDLQDQRTQQGQLYRQQQFGTKVDRAEAEKTLNRMKVLDGQIERAKTEIFAIEDKQVLRSVLQKARKVVEKQQWTKDQETLRRWRDRRNNADAIKKYRTRLKKDVDELTGWVLHPNNKDVVKHIPEVLKSSVIPFLSSVDFTSKRQLRGGDATKADQQFMKRLEALKAALDQKQTTEQLYADYTDLPPDFMEKLNTLTEAAKAIVDKNSGEFVVNQMTSAELKALSEVVRNLKAFIQNFNRFHYNSMFRHVFEAGDNSIDFMGEMKPAEHTGGISKFVLWDQMRPAYAFERFGEGGVAVYDGLRRGQATMAFNTKKIAEFAEKAYTAEEVRAWEKDVKTIELDGSIIKMPVSTIMSFYELSKRPQALGHILGVGVRVATFKADGKKLADGGHKLTIEDVNTIIDQLTDRQKEVADNLQRFMQEQGGKWGNYVSMKRFGEKLFGEDHYFPINSDGRYLPANAEEKPGNASLYALLNMGFTKATTENASNQIVLYSIFDVFSSHMASMAQYNAFALPVVDALKWFNYQQKGEPDENGKREVAASVRDLMDKTYGVPEETRPGSGKSGYAQNFVINIIKAFNGTEAQGTPYDSLGMKTLHQYNRAQVAYNTRVIMQQPLAITRAAQLIDYASIIKGMKLNPDAIRENIAQMQKYSGIAAWKALGFYDVNISRGLTSIIKHDETWQEKVIEFGMKGAEAADTLTWAGIWSACKEEVMRKQKLKPSDAGFYDAVTKLFEDVIYKTQVVDSVLTKNEFMRDKGFFARTVGSFMSEPTTTASMLIDSLDKLNMDMQRGMTRQQAWKKNKGMIVRTAYVYGVGAVLLAAVQAVADAWRDDDEYQTGGEKWLEAFAGNLVDELVPFNKLPIVSDVYELAKELLSVFGVDTYGNSPQSVFMQWYDSLVKGTEIIYGKIKGTEDRYTWYGGAYKLLQAVSGIVGLPIAAATREIVTAWNNIVGAMAPSLKIKSYDAGDWNEIKYGYKDGYLTEEEATDLLIEKNLVKNDNEAFFTLREWDFGEGYSRYHTIYDVVRNGGDFAAALKELTSHGYTEKEVLSEVKSKIGEWYKGKEITKQQATDMLSKNFGMDSKEVTSTVNRWSSKVVTGVAFEDIKDEFLNGNITASKAIDWYVRYGGYSRENATETVAAWNFEKQYGFAYDDRVTAYKKGLVSAAKLRKAMIEYGGLSEADADNNLKAYEWMKKNPQYDLSVTTVLSYTKPIEDLGYSVEESGIKPDTFQNYTNLRKDCKGVDSNNDGYADRNTVKNQVMDVIDDLPITNQQKDTLYFLNGWAKSTLYQAPWH